MARAGDALENAVSGARIIFRKTARDTNGELLQFDLFLKRYLFTGAGIIRPRQEERFEAVSGTMRFRVGENEQSLSAGQILVVPPGTPHTWWNDGDEEAHVLVEVRPALKLETFFETVFGLARDGKLTRWGAPNLLQGAVLAREHDFFLARPPILLQRALIAVLAPVARLLGYRARYPQYSGEESQAPSDER